MIREERALCRRQTTTRGCRVARAALNESKPRSLGTFPTKLHVSSKRSHLPLPMMHGAVCESSQYTSAALIKVVQQSFPSNSGSARVLQPPPPHVPQPVGQQVLVASCSMPGMLPAQTEEAVPVDPSEARGYPTWSKCLQTSTTTAEQRRVLHETLVNPRLVGKCCHDHIGDGLEAAHDEAL